MGGLSCVFNCLIKQEDFGAGDGSRTRDTKLGKLVLYQLSYARVELIYTIEAVILQEAFKGFLWPACAASAASPQ